MENITDNPIETFYRQEINKNIVRIETALNEIGTHGYSDDEMRTIISGCLQIMDLGMIHGYDGVEAIAERMHAAARYCALNGEASLDKNMKRLDDAMQTLRQVVELSEEVAVKSYVEETNTKMDFQIDDIIALEEQDTESDDYVEPLRNRKNLNGANNEDVFEIKEFTAIRKIRKSTEEPASDTVDEEHINAENIAAEFDRIEPFDDTIDDPDYLQAFEEGDVTIIESTLDDITMEKVLTDLEQIEKAIDKIQDDRDDTIKSAAIQEIREATSDLRIISEEEALQPVAEIIYPMERIASEKLRSTVAIDAMDVLQECTHIVREFLDSHELSLSKLTALRSELNTKLFVGERRSPFDDLDLENLPEIDDEDEEIQIIKTPFVAKLRKLFGMY